MRPPGFLGGPSGQRWGTMAALLNGAIGLCERAQDLLTNSGGNGGSADSGTVTLPANR